MKSYLSSQLEVIAALNGSLSKLIVPVKPQPSESWMKNVFLHYPDGRMFDHKGKQRFWISGGSERDEILPPYPPDSPIYFREAWALGCKMDDCEPVFDEDDNVIEMFYYRADDPELPWYEDGHRINAPWKSAATMPREAARIYAKLGEPTVELVDGIWNWAYPVTVVSINGKPE